MSNEEVFDLIAGIDPAARRLVLKAMRDAVAAERERCARVVRDCRRLGLTRADDSGYGETIPDEHKIEAAILAGDRSPGERDDRPVSPEEFNRAIGGVLERLWQD